MRKFDSGIHKDNCRKEIKEFAALCGKYDALSVGERLRVLRLRAGLKIDEAAKAVGIDRGTLMNYELGRVGRMKRSTPENLERLYKKC